MRKSRFNFSLYVLAILLFMSVAIANAAPQEANFVGTWNLTVTGGQGGDGHQGGDQSEAQGEGGGHRGGRGPQSITITKDGDNFKVDHKTPRGDVMSNATVSGNTISWTEERQGREGNSHKVQFKATLSGDSLTGTMAGGQGSRDFTAKRAG
jgi:opacity protein-like surface antigen